MLQLSNAMICQPQQRNVHGRVFGVRVARCTVSVAVAVAVAVATPRVVCTALHMQGFLIRRAFELAFATAYLFCGELPLLVEVDEVAFRSPVEVGNLVQFDSCVLYKSDNGDSGSASSSSSGGDSAVSKGVAGTAASVNPSLGRSVLSVVCCAVLCTMPAGGRVNAHPSVRCRCRAHVHVEVVACVTDPVRRTNRVSNTFNFTFACSKAGSVARVLPSSHEEATRIVSRCACHCACSDRHGGRVEHSFRS